MTTVNVTYPLSYNMTLAADATALTAVDATTFGPGTRYYVTSLGVFYYAPGSTAAAVTGSIIAATPVGNWLLDTSPHWAYSTAGLILGSQSIDLATGSVYKIAGTQVVGAQIAGYQNSQGTGTSNQSAINSDNITATDPNMQLLAKWLKGITSALLTHGLIG